MLYVKADSRCLRLAVGAIACSVLVIGIGTARTPLQSGSAGFAEPGEPLPSLTDAEQDLHIRGRRLFRWELWRPDRSATGFNATECSKCHVEPTFGGSGKVKDDFAAFVPDQADSSGWKAFHRLQRNEGGRFTRSQIPPNAEIRRAPSLFGAGLLELVPDSDLNGLADPEDANGDGVSGRRLKLGDKYGRFGWKASVPALDSFVIAAFKSEMGISISPFEPDDFDGLGMSQIRAVTFYIQTLSPPRAKPLSTTGRNGKRVFERLRCGQCHVPTLTTGSSPTKALDRKLIAAYTDLLLHEMSDTGKSHRSIGPPSATEYRTPPLWGLAEFGGPFWHDGSAPSLEDAISKHGGEAAESRSLFEKLGASERKALLHFLSEI